MADIMDINESLQSQVLNVVTAGQEAVVTGVRSWTATVDSVTPDAVKITPKGLTAGGIPGLVDLPDPDEVIDASFGFFERLLASQKGFAHGLVAALDATAPAAKNLKAA